MRAWRIYPHNAAYVTAPDFDPLNGAGGRVAANRWNDPGHPVIYAAGNPSLAALETIANLRHPVVFGERTIIVSLVGTPSRMGGNMRKVDMDEAQTNLAKLVRSALEGEDVVISRRGKPVVRLVPFLAPEGLRPVGLHRLPPGGSTEDFVDESIRPVTKEEMSEWTADLVPPDERS